MQVLITNNDVTLVLETFESAVYRSSTGHKLVFRHNNKAKYTYGTTNIDLVTVDVLEANYKRKKSRTEIVWVEESTGKEILRLDMKIKTLVDINTNTEYHRTGFGYILNKLSKYFTYNQSARDLYHGGVLAKNGSIHDIDDNPKKLLQALNIVTNINVRNYIYYLYNKTQGLSGKDAMFNASDFGYCIKTFRSKTGFYFNKYRMSEGTKSLMSSSNKDSNVKTYNKNSKTMQFKIGLLRSVLIYIQNNYPLDLIEIVDQRINKINVKPKADRIYSVGGLTAYPYQVELIDKVLDDLSDEESLGHLFTCVNTDLATNSGKTLMLLLICLNIYDPEIIIPCHTDLLFSKTVADYMELGMDVSCICSDNSKRQCKKHLKNEGIETEPLWNTLGSFCVVMIPTLVPRIEQGEYNFEQLRKFNIGVFDEFEDIIAKKPKQFQALMNVLRLGLRNASSGSSTEVRSLEKRYTNFEYFGKTRVRITNKDNIERGTSLPGIFDMELVQQWPSLTTDEVLANKKRLDIVINWLHNKPINHTLIYVGRNKHKLILDIQKTLQSTFPNKIVEVLTGYTKNRADIIERINSGKVNILITSSVASRGMNWPILDSVVNYNPLALTEEVLQAIYGRPMRTYGDMTHYYGLDLFDTTSKHEKASYQRYQVHCDPDQGCFLNLSPELSKYLNTHYGQS